MSTPIAPRTVYTSACGRVTVTRDGPCDFSIALDGAYIGSRDTSWQAEYDAREALCATIDDEAVLAADEQAEQDACTIKVIRTQYIIDDRGVYVAVPIAETEYIIDDRGVYVPVPAADEAAERNATDAAAQDRAATDERRYAGYGWAA